MLPNIIGFGSKVRFSFPLLTDIIIALLYVSKEIVQKSFLRSSLPNTPSGSVSKRTLRLSVNILSLTFY